MPALRLFLMVIALAAGIGAGQAQILDYGRLLGLEPAAPAQTPAPAQTQPQTPAQPLAAPPRQSTAPAPGPTLEAYGTLTEPPMLGAAQTAVMLFRTRLIATLDRIPDALPEIATTLAAASPTGKGVYFLGIALFAALLLVVGRGVTELYAALVARPIFVALQRVPPRGYADKLPVLVYRVLLTLVGTTLTLAVASGVGLVFYNDHETSLLTVLTLFGIYAAAILTDTVLRVAIAPFLPEYRLVVMPDRAARKLYRWLSIASAIGLANAGLALWTLGLGLTAEVQVLVTGSLALVTVVLLLAAIRANRAEVTAVMTGDRPWGETPWLTRAAAVLWAPALALYLVVAWGDLMFRLVMGIESGPLRLLVPFLTLFGGLCIYAFTLYGIERVFRHQARVRAINARVEERRAAETAADLALAQSGEMATTSFGDSSDQDGDGEDEGSAPPRGPRTPLAPEDPAAPPGAEEDDRIRVSAAPPPPRGGMRTMEDLARRVASLFALGVGAYALLRFWGGSGIFAENALLGIAEDLIDVLLIGYIAFHAARIWIDQRIAEEGGDFELAPGDEGGATSVSRLATLLPLLRNFILIVIATSVAVIVATELGVNVAPLFAGAGIVGLAIGFGAQTLVRDILSGAFFLIDDAFRKGEYIDVGDVKGTVEKISLRSFQLRHHLGMLHTIPFGEIQFLTNFSRDWVIMKLPLRLTYDTDVDKVRRLIKKLGQQLLTDPEVGDRFLQPLKSQGVIMMEDSAMIVRVKFMTRPGDQWVVRKRVFQEIRSLFAQEGVMFAHREVTVHIPGIRNAPPTEAEAHAIGAAARTALDVVDAETRLGTGTHGPVDDR